MRSDAVIFVMSLESSSPQSGFALTKTHTLSGGGAHLIRGGAFARLLLPARVQRVPPVLARARGTAIAQRPLCVRVPEAGLIPLPPLAIRDRVAGSPRRRNTQQQAQHGGHVVQVHLLVQVVMRALAARLGRLKWAVASRRGERRLSSRRTTVSTVCGRDGCWSPGHRLQDRSPCSRCDDRQGGVADSRQLSSAFERAWGCEGAERGCRWNVEHDESGSSGSSPARPIRARLRRRRASRSLRCAARAARPRSATASTRRWPSRGSSRARSEVCGWDDGVKLSLFHTRRSRR